MRVFKIFSLLAFATTVIAQNRRPARQKIRLSKFTCLHDAEIVKDTFCDYKLIRGKFGAFSFQFTFIRPVENVWIKVDTYDKGSANYYMDGAVHINQDLCQLYEGHNNLLLHFMPQLKQVFDMILQKCPYKGRMEVLNYTLESVDSVVDFFPIMPTGDYKLVLSLQTGKDVSKFFYQLELLVAHKGVSTVGSLIGNWAG